MAETLESHDDDVRPYCGRLGGPATFRHCRTQGGATLCPRIIQCWQKRFDVAGLLARSMSAQELEAQLSRLAEDRVARLARLAEELSRPAG